MSFYHRYELVRLIQNGEPKTFEAREISSGREVLLHLWSMGEASHHSDLLIRLQQTMRTNPAALLGAVIEVQESAEPPYVVTVKQDDFPGLEAWLDEKTDPAPAPVAPPPPKPAPAPAAPAAAAAPPQGEFTRMFGAPPVKPEQPAFQPPAATPPAARTPPAQPPAGEFTRLFGAQPPPVEPPPPPALPAFDVAPPFGPASTPPPPPKPPAAPAASHQPGEFTKLFGSPLGANPLPVEEIERGILTPPPAPASDRPFRGPSEFTIQFGHNAGAEGAPPPPPPPPEFNKNLAATGLFSVPVPEQHQAPPPAQPLGPGEFTRVMMRPASFQPQPPAAPPPVAPAAPPAAPGTLASIPVQNQKPWLAPLIAVLTTLVVLLVIAVIVLLLKR